MFQTNLAKEPQKRCEVAVRLQGKVSCGGLQHTPLSESVIQEYKGQNMRWSDSNGSYSPGK